jgi:hypothetical protein
MNDASGSEALDDIQRIRHDIFGDISAIRMGLEALKGSRQEAESFDEIASMMEQNLTTVGNKVDRALERFQQLQNPVN